MAQVYVGAVQHYQRSCLALHTVHHRVQASKILERNAHLLAEPIIVTARHRYLSGMHRPAELPIKDVVPTLGVIPDNCAHKYSKHTAKRTAQACILKH